MFGTKNMISQLDNKNTNLPVSFKILTVGGIVHVIHESCAL